MPSREHKITEKPVTIVIVGATGDLAQKKLFPSLFNLYKKGLLPEGSSIIAFSRRPWTDNDFRDYVQASFADKKVGKKLFKTFLNRISYHEGYFEDQAAFDRLVTRLEECDIRVQTYTNKYIYLSVSPDSYGEIITRLGKSFAERSKKMAVKLLIEKPFGKSVSTAKALEKVVARYFKSKDVFLVDHYLGKAALNCFMAVGKEIPHYFSKLWNGNCIEWIEAKLFESKDIDGRSEFYDAVGALRDVGQNHLLETLATVAVSPRSTAKNLQKNREAFIKNLKPVPTSVVRAQYKGYAADVGTKTETETYFKIGLTNSDPHWKNIVFTMEAGKAMPEMTSEVSVKFKEHTKPFIVRIQPKAQLQIPSEDGKRVEKVNVDESLDAYEEVFLAAFHDDVSRFPAIGEIYTSWKLVDSIRKSFTEVPLQLYAKGSLISKK